MIDFSLTIFLFFVDGFTIINGKIFRYFNLAWLGCLVGERESTWKIYNYLMFLK